MLQRVHILELVDDQPAVLCPDLLGHPLVQQVRAQYRWLDQRVAEQVRAQTCSATRWSSVRIAAVHSRMSSMSMRPRSRLTCSYAANTRATVAASSPETERPVCGASRA